MKLRNEIPTSTATPNGPAEERSGLRVVVSSLFMRNVGVLTAANALNAGLSVVQSVLVARWLGPELYGVAALIMSIPNIMLRFFDARSTQASLKYLSEFHARGEGQRALAMCRLGYAVDLAIAVAAFAVTALLAPWAARHIVHRSEFVGLILVYAIAFLPRAFHGTSYSVLASLGRFPLAAGLGMVSTAIRVGLVLGLVAGGFGVAGVIWGNAIALSVGGLLYLVTAYFLSRSTWGQPWWRVRWGQLRGFRREIVRFLGFSELTELLGLIPKQLDVVLLGYFRGPTEVGYYHLAKRLIRIIAYLVGPLQSVTYPELARLWGVGKQGAFRRKVKQLALSVGVPLGILSLVGVLVMPYLVLWIVGATYIPSVVAAQFLLAGSGVWLAVFWLRPLFLARGAVREWTVVIAAFSLVTLIGWLLLVPSYGYLGMSVWWFLSVVLAYVGPALGMLLRSDLARTKKKPDWNEYTANLALKKATTATDTALLQSYVRGKVLDAGCGTGIRLSQVASWGAEMAVGVDLGMPGLRYAREHYPLIPVLAGSVYHLPFRDKQFDLVYSIDVLEHLDDPLVALKEYYRVCRPGGIVFLQTPNYPIKRVYDLWHVLRGTRSEWRDDATHVSKLNGWTLTSLVSQAGFRVKIVTARNVPLQKHIRALKRSRSTSVGRALGQKIIVVAERPRS